MDANARKGGDGVEGALAALAGAGILLLLGWPTLPVALAAMPSAALAGLIVGVWSPRRLGIIAFSIGCGTGIVALAANGQGLAVLFGWLVLVPWLALPIGAVLVPLGLADPPAPPPPVQRPAWAERPLGPAPGRWPLDRTDTPAEVAEVEMIDLPGPRFSGAIFRDGVPVLTGTSDAVGVPEEPSERGRAVGLACAGALLAWPLALVAIGACMSALILLFPVPADSSSPLWADWADGEFWADGFMLAFLFGIPGLCIAAARLAGERMNLAFLRGVGAAVGHALLALIVMTLSAVCGGYLPLLAYLLVGAAWAWGWIWGWRQLSIWRSGTVSRR